MEQLLLPRDGFSGRVCTVAEIIDESSEVGGRYRGSQGGGTGRSSGVSRPRNQRPRFCCSGGRRRLAAVCCQAEAIYGSLLVCRGALKREKPTGSSCSQIKSRVRRGSARVSVGGVHGVGRRYPEVPVFKQF